MKQRIGEMLVRALRSREYDQSRYGLHDQSGGFCVNGILCELHRLECGGEWVDSQLHGDDDMYYLGQDSALPTEVIDWAEVAGNGSDSVIIDGSSLPLFIHNDRGIPFAQLADAIEHQLIDKPAPESPPLPAVKVTVKLEPIEQLQAVRDRLRLPVSG